jgi:hypothetical protein
VFLLLAVELLPKILLAVTGVAALVVIVRALAVGGAISIHGSKVGNKGAGDGVAVAGEELGGVTVAADVSIGSREGKCEI